VKRVFILAVSFFLCACAMDTELLKNYWRPSYPFRLSNYAEVRQSSNTFRILLLADIQCTYFSNGMDEPFLSIPETYDNIARDIKTYKPDLLALLGDNVAGAGFFNAMEAQRFIAFLDGFKIPYVPVMGNHDGEGYFTLRDDNRQRLIAAIFEKGNYSLFRSGPDAIHGIGNYAVHITDPTGGLWYSLVMLDSGRGYIHTDQIQWYEWYVNGLASEAGTAVPSLVFMHIPLPEMLAIRDELLVNNPSRAVRIFRESPAVQKANTGFFEKVKALGSTTHLFFGHDHKNVTDPPYNYQGIDFVYGLKTGTVAYHDRDRIGTALVTLNGSPGPGVSVSVSFNYW
jgi:3',5'-cyclic AMP phosphodiesterase CpdA